MALGVTLAIVIGLRLDQAALTALVGTVCGVAASIPTGFLVVALLRRRDLGSERRMTRNYGQPMNHNPPVIVVSPPAAPQLPQSTSWPGAYSAQPPVQREFAVIGEEGVDDGFDYWSE
jgi:hypothetical protein